MQLFKHSGSEGNITRVARNLAFAQRKESAISGHFLLIFLCLGPKMAGKKPALNPGTRVSLVKVLANRNFDLPQLPLQAFDVLLKDNGFKNNGHLCHFVQ